jgi:2-phospho-L-lactate guanylyltransferase
VLVPVGPLDEAKGRLAGLLKPAERAGLMQRTLATVLEAALGAKLPVTVLSPEHDLRDTLPDGVAWMDEDPELRGLNAQLDAAARRLDTDAVLIVHADIPAVRVDDFERIVAEAPEPPGVAITVSPDGGTNAMLVQPYGGFALHYGRKSADAHEAAARAAGYTVERVEGTEFALDLDVPESLWALLETPAGRETAAGRYLASLGIGARREKRRKR